jgi:hypothetical protein
MIRTPYMLAILMSIAGLLPIHSYGGNITTDGTVGAAGTLTGPTYAIPQSLGTILAKHPCVTTYGNA